MFCSKCGTEVQDGVSFCSSCGSQVKAQLDPKASQGTYVQVQNQPKFDGEMAGLRVEKNTISTVALVLGIVTAVTLFQILLLAIATVITASFALSKSGALSRKGVLMTGKGRSIAGLSLGIFGTVLGLYNLGLT
jgi:uncharacterized membrane protein YvbJ